ncbi:hypothetical protein R20943_03070 [Paraburkholderia aspalathi]|nr:hypothetical protein R20943_03070 [Paraburkholderia aspalathi]
MVPSNEETYAETSTQRYAEPHLSGSVQLSV